jgi:hypothetical protein
MVQLDTAADDVVFPVDLAPRLGVDLAGAIQRQAAGVGAGQGFPVWYAGVILQATDGAETWRWRATVAFTRAYLRWPLFGVAGGLEFFRTTVDWETKEMVLLAKATLPLTLDATP